MHKAAKGFGGVVGAVLGWKYVEFHVTSFQSRRHKENIPMHVKIVPSVVGGALGVWLYPGTCFIGLVYLSVEGVCSYIDWCKDEYDKHNEKK